MARLSRVAAGSSIGLAMCLCNLARAGPAEAQEPFPGLDAFVLKAMADWKVPGVSVAIVRNDSVLHVKGYGVRTLGSADRVDDRTLFEIGSASKPFTGTLAAMIVSDGAMQWDDRLSLHLEDFRLLDAYANSEVTVRDALSHRTGLSRGDMMWLGAGVSREEVLHRVRFQQPSTSFRSTWAYNNVMFSAAGLAAAKAANSTWDDLIQRRIFAPLRMTESVPVIRDYSRYPNVASPHTLVRADSVAPKDHMNLDGVAPAGSINSNARDMAQWLRFQMGDGTYEGKRLVSAAALHETRKPQMVIANPPFSIPGPVNDSLTTFHTYGLGWFVDDYRGHLYWNHGGNTDGMTSAQGMMPDQKFGVVVLSNMNQSPVPLIITRYLFDRQLELPVRDWSATTLRDRSGRGGGAGRGGQAVARTASGPPPLPLAAYAGTYADSMYGEVVISVRDNRLRMHRGEWDGTLDHVSGDHFIFTIVPASRGPMPIKFDVTPDGRVVALSMGATGDANRFGRRPAAGAAGRGGRP